MKMLYCVILAGAMLAATAASGVETFAEERNVFNAVVSTDALTDEKDVFTPEGVVAALPTKNTDQSLYVQINGDGVLMKSDSNDNTRTIRTLPDKYALSVLGAEYGWVQVQDDDGNKGYVNAKNITFHRGAKPDNSQLESVKAKAIVDFSKKFIGTPYGAAQVLHQALTAQALYTAYTETSALPLTEAQRPCTAATVHLYQSLALRQATLYSSIHQAAVFLTLVCI